MQAELFASLGRAGLKLETVHAILRGATTALSLLPPDPPRAEPNVAGSESPTPKDGSPGADVAAGPGAAPTSAAAAAETVYVLDFLGDVGARGVARLAAEVSAVLSMPAEARPHEVPLYVCDSHACSRRRAKRTSTRPRTATRALAQGNLE